MIEIKMRFYSFSGKNDFPAWFFFRHSMVFWPICSIQSARVGVSNEASEKLMPSPPPLRMAHRQFLQFCPQLLPAWEAGIRVGDEFFVVMPFEQVNRLVHDAPGNLAKAQHLQACGF